MKGLTVPGQLILGSGASLGCDYNLEGSKLYSVKWYKDGQEFFRFMPSMDNKIEVFSVRGVNVEVREVGFNLMRNTITASASVSRQQQSIKSNIAGFDSRASCALCSQLFMPMPSALSVKMTLSMMPIFCVKY